MMMGMRMGRRESMKLALITCCMSSRLMVGSIQSDLANMAECKI